VFCSTIIPTVGRTTLARAVQSVLDQAFVVDGFEVVVVNDSGSPLPAAAWQQSDRVRVLDTNRRERSVARNAGAAIAQGRYLHFLDDDDWLLPNALQDLWNVTQRSNAAWIYGSTQLVDRQGVPIIRLEHELCGNGFLQAMAGEWIPLQASLIKTEVFFSAGGFNALLTGPEDIDLLRRILLRHEAAGTTSTVVYLAIGEEGSTTDYRHSPLYSRWARERILEMPGAFARMRRSASSGYWWGRIVRVYLTSMVWNLRRRQVLTGASRAAYATASLGLGASHLASPGFWRAVAKAYQSPAFARGFREAARAASPSFSRAAVR
jgi:glycosyltransferase involved in cell wall biosynthesis